MLVAYSLDDQANITLPRDALVEFKGKYQYSLNFADIPVGYHILIAYASDALYTSRVEKTFTAGTNQQALDKNIN